MEDAQDSTMALTTALQDLEFLVVCPGASLTQSYKRQGGITPSLLELLSQPPTVRQPGGDSDAQGQHRQEGQRGPDSSGIVDPGFSPTALRLVAPGSRCLLSGPLGTYSANDPVLGVRALWPAV